MIFPNYTQLKLTNLVIPTLKTPHPLLPTSGRRDGASSVTSLSTQLHSISIEDPAKNSFVLDGLEEFTLYEVLLQAYNDLGSSEPSPVVLARTREAAPGAGPTGVTAEATSR